MIDGVNCQNPVPEGDDVPRVKGAKPFAYELPADVVDAFRAFARGRGNTVSAELVRALRRHMAYPEPLTAEPELVPYQIPEVPAPPPAEPKPKKKGK